MSAKKVLIIDDDEDLLSSTRLFLESHAFEVITAVNSGAGMELIKSDRPDVIILDIMMDTNLEGFNFLNELKNDPILRQIPVIMNTGMADAFGVNMRSAIEDSENLPCTRFIDKSGDWGELLTVLNELMHG